MKLKDIYKFFIDEGIKTDPRSKAQVKAGLTKVRKEFNATRPSLKKFFDKEKLKNPYSDTRILNGDLNRKVKTILIGIDMEIGELVLADRLNEKGMGIDLVLAHHPEGLGLSTLDHVMHLQTDVLSNVGLDEKIAQRLMSKRIGEVSRSLHGGNHTRSVDSAKLLGIPYMCCHTPADNHVSGFLQHKMDRLKPKTLQRIVDLLMKEPEYQDAARLNAGPRILAGSPKDKAGKIFVDMTGGTEGSKDIYGRLSQCGIKTLLGMHLSNAHFSKAKMEYLNVLIAGHMACDNLGMNLLLDKLERKGQFKILATSGFRRFKR